MQALGTYPKGTKPKAPATRKSRRIKTLQEADEAGVEAEPDGADAESSDDDGAWNPDDPSMEDDRGMED